MWGKEGEIQRAVFTTLIFCEFAQLEEKRKKKRGPWGKRAHRPCVLQALSYRNPAEIEKGEEGKY